MNSSDFRAKAREILNGKWGKAALITLVYMIINFCISFVREYTSNSIGLIISIAYYIISVPLTFGLTMSFVNLSKDKEVGYLDYFSSGFSNFTKSWGITIRMFLKLLVPFIALIVSIMLFIGGTSALYTSDLLNRAKAASLGTVASASTSGAHVGIMVICSILIIVSYIWIFLKSYYFQLSFIIAADDETISSKDAVEKSRELMTGNRFKLFCLQLSFIGWAFLTGLTFGIGFLWVFPYMQVSIIAFYFHLKGDNLNNTKTEVIDETTNTENQ